MHPPIPPVTRRLAGSPGDRARLKLEDLVGVVGQEERHGREDHQARLAADRLLLDELMLRGYEGRSWKVFVENLAGYALPILVSWLRSGQIFVKASRGLGRVKRRPGRLEREDRVDLAGVLISEAVHFFRDKVLRPGKWDVTRGASLRTYFVGSCLLIFPNVYRAWCRETRPISCGSEEALPELKVREPNLVERIDLAERIRSVTDFRNRKILEGIARGQTYGRIAQELGLTERAVEARVDRLRRDLRCETARKSVKRSQSSS